MSKLKLPILVFVVGISLILTGIQYVNQKVSSAIKLDQPTLITIEKGQYAHFIINRLNERGILNAPIAFKIKLKLQPALSAIKSGTYELMPGMSGLDLFNMLVNGEEKQFSIRLVEGLRWKDWLAQLESNHDLNTSVSKNIEWVSQLTPLPEGGSLEGWLLPETYNFTANTTALDIVKRAYVDMREYLENGWKHRALDLPYQTPYEALIMASIIEKETGLASERPRIAGVFVNRLRQNMRLQTDPTVIYGMGDDFDGDIRRKDLRAPTLYNTYVIKGLPPTPIAMPSKLAIDAALNPLDTEALYFVAKGDGSHQFSHSLEEHNAAVRKYQLKR